jgi:diguanylate cyclase (GGDEF)-like protein
MSICVGFGIDMKIKLSWDGGEVVATLRNTPTSQKLLASLPCESSCNTSGEEVYTRKKALSSDVVDIARFLGAFQSHFHAFSRDLESDHRHEIMTQIGTDQFNSVIRQVENMLTSSGKKELQHSPAQWWDEVTVIIDALKVVENSLSGEMKKRVNSAIVESQAELTRYIIAAICLIVLMTAMAVFTLIRILGALSVLLNALSSVINTQDYSIRVGSDSSTDEFGRINLSLNKLLDLTDALIQKKDHLASVDELTGLFNRRSFQEKSNWEMKRAARYGRPLCFIICDIDHFKSVNDTYGHALGDDVLKHVAALFREQVRASDLVGRWGGEEFVILAVESDLEVGAALAEKLRTALEELSIQKVGKITCSFGVALWRDRDEEMDVLCDRADTALYQAKKEGRNRVVTA